MHPVLSRGGSLLPYLSAWGLVGGLIALLLGPDVSGLATAFALCLPLGIAFGFLGLAAFFPCRATPLAEGRPIRFVSTHAAAALLSAAVWLTVGEVWSRALALVPPTASAAPLFGGHRGLFFGLALLLYGLAAAVHYVLIALQDARAASQRALELRVAARDAELGALRAQIDPHFLFNSLNALAALAGSDPKATRAMAIGLADFFRQTRALADRPEVTLAEELALARAYLALETVRFGDRLRVEDRVDERALGWKVPPLLLQPLVENAVRHGVARRVHGGTVHLGASVSGEVLLLIVENDLDAAAPPAPAGSGLGLANVERRLRLTHGASARFRTVAVGERFRVEIEIAREGAESHSG